MTAFAVRSPFIVSVLNLYLKICLKNPDVRPTGHREWHTSQYKEKEKKKSERKWNEKYFRSVTFM